MSGEWLKRFSDLYLFLKNKRAPTGLQCHSSPYMPSCQWWIIIWGVWVAARVRGSRRGHGCPNIHHLKRLHIPYCSTYQLQLPTGPDWFYDYGVLQLGIQSIIPGILVIQRRGVILIWLWPIKIGRWYLTSHYPSSLGWTNEELSITCLWWNPCRFMYQCSLHNILFFIEILSMPLLPLNQQGTRPSLGIPPKQRESGAWSANEYDLVIGCTAAGHTNSNEVFRGGQSFHSPTKPACH